MKKKHIFFSNVENQFNTRSFEENIKDYFSNLPPDIFYLILSELDTHNSLTLSGTSNGIRDRFPKDLLKLGLDLENLNKGVLTFEAFLKTFEKLSKIELGLLFICLIMTGINENFEQPMKINFCIYLTLVFFSAFFYFIGGQIEQLFKTNQQQNLKDMGKIRTEVRDFFDKNKLFYQQLERIDYIEKNKPSVLNFQNDITRKKS